MSNTIKSYIRGDYEGILHVRKKDHAATDSSNSRHVSGAFEKARIVDGKFTKTEESDTDNPIRGKKLKIYHEDIRENGLQGFDDIDSSKTINGAWLTSDPKDHIFIQEDENGTFLRVKGKLTIEIQESTPPTPPPIPPDPSPVDPPPVDPPPVDPPPVDPPPVDPPPVDPPPVDPPVHDPRPNNTSTGTKPPTNPQPSNGNQIISENHPSGGGGNGANGARGDRGDKGDKGDKGDSGGIFTGLPRPLSGCLPWLLALFLLLGSAFFLLGIYHSWNKSKGKTSNNCTECESQVDSLKNLIRKRGDTQSTNPPGPDSGKVKDTTKRADPTPSPPQNDSTKDGTSKDKEDETENRRNKAKGQEGLITVSIIWDSKEDLDLAVAQPNGNILHYKDGNADMVTQGRHDIDWKPTYTTKPIENVYIKKPQPGEYKVYVRRYSNNIASSSIKFKLTVDQDNNRKKDLHKEVRPVIRNENPAMWNLAYTFNYPPK